MPILSGPEIVRTVTRTRNLGADAPLPRIDITPFDPARAGPNSYDVTLGPTLRVYRRDAFVESAGDGLVTTDWYLDPEKNNPTREIDIPPGGYVLRPGECYLGSIAERTTCSGVVPWIDGRSSTGRLFLAVHVTAGRGDDGFGEEEPGGCSWTLEMVPFLPVKVRAGMRIAQLTYFGLVGERKPYRGKYGKQPTGPVASRMWEDAPPAGGDGLRPPVEQETRPQHPAGG